MSNKIELEIKQLVEISINSINKRTREQQNSLGVVPVRRIKNHALSEVLKTIYKVNKNFPGYFLYLHDDFRYKNDNEYYIEVRKWI